MNKRWTGSRRRERRTAKRERRLSRRAVQTLVRHPRTARAAPRKNFIMETRNTRKEKNTAIYIFMSCITIVFETSKE